ncbi:MAG: rod shape-determining protein MreD [Gemmatimonadales bacterium]
MRLDQDKVRLVAVVLLLVLLHFGLGPWLGDRRVGPDFLVLALLIYAMRARPGKAAIAGFTVGLVGDSLTVLAFGSSALAHTMVGHLTAWGNAIFFAENLLVSAGFFFGGTWFRDLLMLVAGGFKSGVDLVWQLAFWSVIKGLTTALTGVAVLMIFRRWLNVRMAV